MKILVTGHRGFIGSHLIESLKKAGQECYGYDLVDGNDVRDKLKLEHLFETENFDTVIHLAALTGVRRGELYPEEYISTNVMGTKNVVDACEKFGVTKLINFSSSSVYGDIVFGLRSAETMPKRPQSIYGMTKLMAEHIVERSGEKLLTFNIRPFTVYGSNGRKDQVIMRWIEDAKNHRVVKVFANKKADADNMIRGFTHISDLIKGVRSILEMPKERWTYPKNTFNLGGSEPVSLSMLVDVFIKAVKGNNFEYQYVGRQSGDISYSVAKTQYAEEVIGWKPTADFTKEVTKIIKEGLKS